MSEVKSMTKENGKTTLSKKTEKEQDLLKKIAYHEVYSTAYKLSLAKILLVKGAKAASKAAVKGGKFIKTKYVEVKEHREDKRAEKRADKRDE
jgi:hypothetical protein